MLTSALNRPALLRPSALHMPLVGPSSLSSFRGPIDSRGLTQAGGSPFEDSSQLVINGNCSITQHKKIVVRTIAKLW